VTRKGSARIVMDILVAIGTPLALLTAFFLIGVVFGFLSKMPTRYGERTYLDFSASCRWAFRGTRKALILGTLWLLSQMLVGAVKMLLGR
jgi:hypothetical protein